MADTLQREPVEKILDALQRRVAKERGELDRLFELARNGGTSAEKSVALAELAWMLDTDASDRASDLSFEERCYILYAAAVEIAHERVSTHQRVCAGEGAFYRSFLSAIAEIGAEGLGAAVVAPYSFDKEKDTAAAAKFHCEMEEGRAALLEDPTTGGKEVA